MVLLRRTSAPTSWAHTWVRGAAYELKPSPSDFVLPLSTVLTGPLKVAKLGCNSLAELLNCAAGGSGSARTTVSSEHQARSGTPASEARPVRPAKPVQQAAGALLGSQMGDLLAGLTHANRAVDHEDEAVTEEETNTSLVPKGIQRQKQVIVGPLRRTRSKTMEKPLDSTRRVTRARAGK
ncbi:uncharacterized protein EDB91DRAFT_1081205 [Suillus paluster]|uniref:uncharacterized protein n=1 Tax=Suillus paluster TaxID=48578 RepID=UPI001B87F523|nr:uncharacterized protein EDB91DRAFT_1081205 [Suillus paluster]KAG1743263.1 hypothetical protein EDB91DRAFT_1081205 [Suillus paluster]